MCLRRGCVKSDIAKLINYFGISDTAGIFVLQPDMARGRSGTNATAVLFYCQYID